MEANESKIAERVADSALAKIQLVTGWYEGAANANFAMMEEACTQWAIAEERERVLREALKKQNRYMRCQMGSEEYPSKGCKCEACDIQRLVISALATPAPEQPSAEKAGE